MIISKNGEKPYTKSGKQFHPLSFSWFKLETILIKKPIITFGIQCMCLHQKCKVNNNSLIIRLYRSLGPTVVRGAIFVFQERRVFSRGHIIFRNGLKATKYLLEQSSFLLRVFNFFAKIHSNRVYIKKKNLISYENYFHIMLMAW